MLRAVFLALFVASAYGALAPCFNELQVIDCQSKGVYHVRVQDCSSLPCAFFGKKTYNLEIELEPSVAHNSLNLVIQFVGGGQGIVNKNETLAVAVEAGKSTTIAYPWTLAGSVPPAGEYGVRIELIGDRAGGVREFCGIIDSFVIPSSP